MDFDDTQKPFLLLNLDLDMETCKVAAAVVLIPLCLLPGLL